MQQKTIKLITIIYDISVLAFKRSHDEF